MKTESPNQYVVNPASINAQDFISKVIKKWPWFLISGLVGLIAGILVNQYFQAKYEISTTLLLKTDAEKASIGSVFNDQRMTGRSTNNPMDQAGIVQSYRLNLKAINNLQWMVSWYEVNLFTKTDLYLNEPFRVTKNGPQTEMVPVRIKPLSGDRYEVIVDGKIVTNGVTEKVKLSQEARYNEPFANKYFNFTLQKRMDSTVTEGKEYILIFNDPNLLARQYKSRLEVTLSEENNSNLIYVKLKSTQPLRDITYLNELGSVYIEFGLEEKNKVADNTLRFINNQLIGVTDSLLVASKDFTNFRSRNRIVDLGQEASMVVENFETIEKEEAASRMKLEYYNNLKRYLNDARQMKDVIAPSVVGITDPSLNTLVLKLSDLYSQRELLSYSVQEKNPDLVSLDNTIQYTQKILLENINNLLANTNAELQSMNQRKQRVNALLSRLPKTEQDLVNIKRSFDLNNDLYTFLLRKRAEVGIARASNNPDATILDLARYDVDASIGPSKFAILLIGLVSGFGFSLLVFLLLDYFDTHLKSVDEVESQSALAVAGTIYTNRFKTEIPAIQYPNSAITESFRTLRATLNPLLNDPNKKVIAVHSPMVGEGKSFVAINLAIVLAMNGKRVLLVEADLRRPRLYMTLKLNKEKGLSTYLSEKATLEQIIQPTKIKGLSFVASGAATPNNSELLDTKLFDKFINEAKVDFDFIILDSVPTDLLSDAAIIRRHADINLMVLRLNYSRQGQLKSVNKLAHDGEMENMALIINDVSDKSARRQLGKYGYQ